MTPRDRQQLILSCLPVAPTMVSIDALAADTGMAPDELHRIVESMRHMGAGVTTRRAGRLLAITPEYWPIARREAQYWWAHGGEAMALAARQKTLQTERD